VGGWCAPRLCAEELKLLSPNTHPTQPPRPPDARPHPNADEVRAERQKETKHDAAVALAATLHARGREGVEEDWESTDAFHERWRAKARDVMAKGEWRKRKLTKRVRAVWSRVACRAPVRVSWGLGRAAAQPPHRATT